jgi:guanosine-3',5'-bis(diphosphate) 3'-pyrophosphohydrolase
MQHEESAILGENLLNQELEHIGVARSDVPMASWDELVRDSGNRSMKEIYTDIGLGKRIAAVVARRLLAKESGGLTDEMPQLSTVVIRGTEGMAIQLAPCCHPIPGDPIIGSIRKGQGLVVHAHDCPVILKSRSSEPKKWIDVEWQPAEGKLFEARIRVTAKNSRGVLAQMAAAISEAGSNIENIAMEEKVPGVYTTLQFTLQVSHRIHLASVMRSLRHIPEVVRIARARGE